MPAADTRRSGPLTRRALLRRAGTAALGLALPFPAGAFAARDAMRIRVLGTTPGTGAGDGALLGMEEAEHLGALVGMPVEVDLVRASGPDVLDRLEAREPPAAVVAGADVPWEELEARAERMGIVLVDARPERPAEGRCASKLFRVGIPEADGRTLWHGGLERYGAAQLNERFERRFGEVMDAAAWAAWFSVKALAESLVRMRADDPAQLASHLAGERAVFDGHKGRPLRFRPSDHQLEQPVYVRGPEGAFVEAEGEAARLGTGDCAAPSTGVRP